MAPKGVRPSFVGGVRCSFSYAGVAPSVALLDFFFFLAFFGPRPIILSIMDAIVALVARRRLFGRSGAAAAPGAACAARRGVSGAERAVAHT